MVEELKEEIETEGFEKIIRGHRRTWKDQADSLLDQVWSNCQERTIKTMNETRGSSDHNVVGVVVSLRDIKASGFNIVKRTWKNFNRERCIESLKNQDWESILQELDVNVANSRLEDQLCEVFNIEAPIKTVQARTKFNNWISIETKT